MQAVNPSPELLDYATTKAGIHNFTGLEGAGEKGIRVNAVAPGPIWTPLIPATMPTQKTQSHGEGHLGALGNRRRSPAYVFFASQNPATSPQRCRCHRRPAGHLGGTSGYRSILLREIAVTATPRQVVTWLG